MGYIVVLISKILSDFQSDILFIMGKIHLTHLIKEA